MVEMDQVSQISGQAEIVLCSVTNNMMPCYVGWLVVFERPPSSVLYDEVYSLQS